jgi:geranylgeranylglycerol-phosphate geranylgeranyltransferase
LARLRDWLSIIRTGNSFVIGLADVTGYIVGSGDNVSVMLLLFFSAFLIGCYGNVINDIYDIEIDRVNKPWRPLPSGRIRLESARYFSLICLLTGLALSLLIGYILFIIALSASTLLYMYSRSVKKTGLPGNLLIALLSLLVIVYGGIASINPLMGLYPGVYAFLIILGREVLKGLEDIKGDRRHGVQTIAARYGVRKALFTATVILSIVIFISPFPYVFLGMNIYYILIALLGVDLPIVYALYRVFSDPIRNAWLSTRILKIPLLAGLLAFLLGVL